MVDDDSIKRSIGISQNDAALITTVYKDYTSPEENKRQAEVVEDSVMEIVREDHLYKIKHLIFQKYTVDQKKIATL